MDGEIITSGQSSQSRSEKINILLVDDDTTCLSIIAAILKTYNYEVVTVKHAMDALYALRIKGGFFDLVVTDVNMPDMDGIELQKQIDEEFDLPVVLMSTDANECIIMKGLENGAALFLLKPICPDDLKDLWQYVIANKKRKGKAVVEEIRSFPGTSQANSPSIVEIESSADENENDLNAIVAAKEQKRKFGKKKDNHMKKAKVVWTNSLHNKFLEAIRALGLARSVPKKILDLMKVPGLTRSHVASHLQKYRIFLKRVSNACYQVHSDSRNSFPTNTSQSNFFPGQPSLTYLNQTRTPIQTLLGNNHFPIAKTSNHDHLSTGGSIDGPLYGQSRLLYNNGAMMIANTNSIYSANRIGGGFSRGLMTGKSSIPMYQNQTPQRSLANGMSMYNPTDFGQVGANYSSDGLQMGNFNNSNLNSNKVQSVCSRYVGYRIANGNGGDESDGFYGDFGLINGTRLSNTFNGPIPSGNGNRNLVKKVSSLDELMGFNRSSPTLTNVTPHEYGSGPLLQPNNPVQEGENGDLCNAFFNVQVGGEDPNFSISFSPNDVENNNPIRDTQSLEKQHGGEEVLIDPNFSISELDDYFPWVDHQITNQQQGHEESFNNTVPCNQASPFEFGDEDLLESMFSGDELGGLLDGLGGLEIQP